MLNSNYAFEKLTDLIKNSLSITVNSSVRVFVAGKEFLSSIASANNKLLYYGKVSLSYSAQTKPIWIFKLKGELVYVIDTSSAAFKEGEFQKELLFDEVYLTDTASGGVGGAGGAQNFEITNVNYVSEVNYVMGFLFTMDNYDTDPFTLGTGDAPDSALDVQQFVPSVGGQPFTLNYGKYFFGGGNYGRSIIVLADGKHWIDDNFAIDVEGLVVPGSRFNVYTLGNKVTNWYSDQLGDNIESYENCQLIDIICGNPNFGITLPARHVKVVGGIYKYHINQNDGNVKIQFWSTTNELMKEITVAVVGGFYQFTLPEFYDVNDWVHLGNIKHIYSAPISYKNVSIKNNLANSVQWSSNVSGSFGMGAGQTVSRELHSSEVLSWLNNNNGKKAYYTKVAPYGQAGAVLVTSATIINGVTMAIPDVSTFDFLTFDN
jgi:hypothetical protein